MKPNDIDSAELARILAQTSGEVKDFITQQKSLTDELRERVFAMEQKGAHKFGGGSDSGNPEFEIAARVVASEGAKAFLAGNTQSFQVTLPAQFLRNAMKTAIFNAVGTGQPLVPPDYRPQIVFAPQQRLTIRGLFANVPTQSNLIEWPSEATFTSNARPQGDVSPIGNGEGELKAESAMTFQLNTTNVVTIAHWLPASRQVLSDAPQLQGHVSRRLLYGLKLEEESEMLNGDGGAGKLTGLVSKAGVFTGGATNQTTLDTLAKAAGQLSGTNYEPSGFVLNPADWLAAQLLKDSQGRYILGDPAAATTPSLWGLPVVPTPSMTKGKFLCLDAQRTGYVADREDAVIRVSENVNDHFIRNMVAILCEERVALVIENGSAMVYGDLNYAG